MLYGTPQAGSNTSGAAYNLTALCPGDKITLFDGTETPGASVKSVAFSRAQTASGDNGTTFFIQFGSAPTALVLIQSAFADVEADYQTVWSSTNTQQDAYTDVGRAPFYRAVLSTYSAGGMPVVTATR